MSSSHDDWEEITLTAPQGRTRKPTDLYEPVGGKAQLVILTGARSGTTFEVGERTIVGRGEDADIRLQDEGISREHLEIVSGNGSDYSVRDLGSRNGTLINGLPVEGLRSLRFGDKLRVGLDTLLVFTQLDQLEEQLLQLQKLEAIGQLAGGIAHDFNNLLGVILNNLSYLQSLPSRSSLSEPEVLTCLAESAAAARRAAELTQQLLGFARRGKHVERPTNIGWLVDEVVRLLRRTFDPGVRIEAYTGPQLSVLGDPAQLHQVLMNLCLNARDAMPDGGRLSIEAALATPEQVGSTSVLENGEYVVLTVRDTGCGMDEAAQARVFEPFFTTKGPDRGTGLGLATVYGIVKSHGGHVVLESELGQGTTFRVFFPQLQTEVGITQRILLPTEPSYRGLVLLVDDEELVRASTQRVLESLGHSVLCAGNGRQALDLFAKHRDRVQLAIIDLVMPEMDGEATVCALRETAPDLKILVTSGHDEDRRVRSVLDSGAKSFLQKPFAASDLRRAVFEVLAEAPIC